MVSFSTAFVTALAAATTNALEITGVELACGNQTEIITIGIDVCCPGVMKNAHGITYCCPGGSSDGCGKATCLDDLSTCDGTFNVADPKYAENIKNALNITVNNPNASNTVGVPMYNLIFGMVASLVIVPAVMVSF
ncbi:hypothetical protein F5Y04DRAFT_284259 [Hypomontagnella monticulosa]|nr:hypothetical protein F5Y04DRAFT_284259 [Hypomontagnella monticulosa]